MIEHFWTAMQHWDVLPMLIPLLGFGGSTSSTEPKDVTPPELVALRSPFANAIKNLFSIGGVPNYNPATDAVPTAPIAAGEQQALQRLQGNLSDTTGQDYIKSVLQGNYLPGGSQANPFLQAAIEAAQRQTYQGLEGTLSKALPGRFTQAGQFVNPQGSSAFDMAARLAARDAQQTAADIATNISSGAYTTERQNQQQAVTLGQQDVQTTIANLQAQALPRLIQQYGIDQGLEVFKTRITALLQALSTASGTLVNIGNSSKSETQPNIFGALFPGGLANTVF